MDHIGKNISNRTREKVNISSSSLVEPDLIDKIIAENADVIQGGWERRHGKLIQQKGVGYYEQLAHKARKYGKNPKALMASFVNKEVKRD